MPWEPGVVGSAIIVEAIVSNASEKSKQGSSAGSCQTLGHRAARPQPLAQVILCNRKLIIRFAHTHA